MPRKSEARNLCRLKRNIDFLNLICKSKGGRRSNLVSSVDLDLICCICEVCNNLLNQKIILTPSQKKRAKKHWATVNSFADPSVKVEDKLESLRRKADTDQVGGFIGSVLTPIVGILSGILGSALAK